MARKRKSDEWGARTVNATEAQNNFGQVLGQAGRDGMVYITRYDRPAAVVMSIERYEALVAAGSTELDELAREFDETLQAMQTDQARSAVDTLFEMDSATLAEAAVRGAGRRTG